MAIKQDVNAPLIVTIGVVSGLLLLVTVFGLQAWFVREEREEIAEKWDMSPNTWLNDIRAAERANIERTGSFDEGGAKVRKIPIEQAMQVIAQTNGKLPATQPSQPQKK